MGSFDNIYILDSCNDSDYHISINLINALTWAGPIGMSVFVTIKSNKINKADKEYILNSMDVCIKSQLIPYMINDRDKAFIRRVFYKKLRKISEEYKLDKKDVSGALIIITPRSKLICKKGKDCYIAKNNKMYMIYSSSIRKNISKKEINQVLKMHKDIGKADRYAKELILRNKSRGENSDMGLVCIAAKIHR